MTPRIRLRCLALALAGTLPMLGCAEDAASRPASAPTRAADSAAAVVEVGHLASIAAESLTRPIALRAGLGARDGETATLAQRYVAQGQAYLDGFAWLHAARSFHAALRADPTLPAGRIGLFRAYLGLESPARAARQVEVALTLAANRGLSARERDHLVLARMQRDAVLDGHPGGAVHHAYLEALEKHLKRHPDDVRAMILRGHAERRADGWGQASGPDAVAWYLRVLDVDPGHPGAHHFLAHAFEHQGRHAEAFEHASSFAAAAPGIPHAHHMVAHAAPGVGRWRAAREALERADHQHRAEIESGELRPHEDWHFGHNLRLLGAVRHRLGDREAASAAFREAFELAYGGRRAGFYCAPWIVDLLGRERFAEARLAAEACAARDTVMARLMGRALRGEALLALGDVAGATADRARAARQLEALIADTHPASSEATFAYAARLAIGVLDAKLALNGPDPSAGVARFHSLADAFCAGHSVDSWAICRPRIDELAKSAARAGQGALAAALRSRLAGS